MSVTNDLMTKAGRDVAAAMRLTLQISDDPLPVATAGAASALGTVAALLSSMASGHVTGEIPSENELLLAALICCRIGDGNGQGIARAYQDYEKLTGQAATPPDKV